MEKFIINQTKEIAKFNDGVLTRCVGHFPNCFNQTFYKVSFYGFDFFFNKVTLATDFLYKFTVHHSLNFYKRRFNNTFTYSFVIKLLYDDSINRARFENPDKQKVIEYFASCCSFDFKLVPNGKSLYSLVPIEKSRE